MPSQQIRCISKPSVSFLGKIAKGASEKVVRPKIDRNDIAISSEQSCDINASGILGEEEEYLNLNKKLPNGLSCLHPTGNK